MKQGHANPQAAPLSYLSVGRRFDRVLVLLILFYAAFLAGAESASASEFGRNGFSGNPNTNGGATCSVCHSSGATIPNVTITGPMVVDAGATNEYAVTISSGPAVTGGVNISITDFAGLLSPADPNLQLISSELSHTAPKAFQSGDVIFSFLWTAPAHNTDVTIFAAGNSSNGQLNLAGDGINTGTLDITVQNGSQPPPPDPPSPAADLALDEVVVGLNSPVAIAHAADGRLFVVEQPGRIRIVDANGDLLSTPFLDIESRVDDGDSEQGLLGLAFEPDYESSGYFYVYYTRDPGAGLDRSRIARFQVSADPNLADPDSEVVIMEFEQPRSNHNAGDLHFGPDGYLYIASGDGGDGGDPQNLAQNKSSLLGKLLRIDVDVLARPDDAPDCDISGNSNYRIPPSNAFNDGSGGQGCDEIYALGLRNPWRFSFDRLTGDLWIADVGQNNYEEINRVLFGAAGGLNFGWRCYEGDHPFNTDGCDDQYFFPVYEYSHADGNCSVTGGFVYRGLDYPALDGHYFFTDFCNASIRTLSDAGNGLIPSEALASGAISAPSAFGEDANGELYIASLSDGVLYKIRGLASFPPPIGAVAYMSSSASSANVDGVLVRDEDIVAYDINTDTWSMYFDGSDVGVGGTQDLNAFHIDVDGSILMALADATTLLDVGPVEPADIVRFIPTSTGGNTAGTFAMVLDGSDVELGDSQGEPIDAIGMLPDGRIVISTQGNFNALGVKAKDEDLIAFNATQLGPDTIGTWELYFDGSDVELSATSSGGVNGVWVDDTNGNIYLTFLGAFTVAGASGDELDIIVCTPGSVGASTSCIYSPFIDGSTIGLTEDVGKVDGISLSWVRYVNTSGSGNAGGVSFRDEDIVAYGVSTGTWSMYFDGSDVGLASSDLNAFHIDVDGSVLLSMKVATTLPDVGPVEPSDIVRFIPTSTGGNTAGTFAMVLDGSDVGLEDTQREPIDAIGILPDGRIVISTQGNFSAPGLSAKDEDLIAFNDTQLGPDTLGTWELYFDGSDVGLGASSADDVSGAWVDHTNGDIHFTTRGEPFDIVVCTPGSLGLDTSCTYRFFWNPQANGLTAAGQLDGVSLSR